jgi:RNA polymerase sigma-70 factor (ECF subfamily)
VALRERSRCAAVALVDGDVGLVVAPRGRLLLALTVTVEGERITAYDVIADPARLGRLDLGVLDLPEVSPPSRTP